MPVSCWIDDQRNTYTEKNALFWQYCIKPLLPPLICRAPVPGCASESAMCGSACFLPPAWTLFFCLLIKSWSMLESHMRGWFHCIFTGLHPCLMWQRTSITCTARQLLTPAVWGVRQTLEVLLFVPYLKWDGTFPWKLAALLLNKSLLFLNKSLLGRLGRKMREKQNTTEPVLSP